VARSLDARVAAMSAALAPYPWRGFTDRMLVRRVIGAADRQAVASFVARIPGAQVHGAGPFEPAEPDDERVDALVRALEGRLWREWSLARLCIELMASLELWQAENEAFHAGLRQLLHGR
jgi:hypothetical protein